MKMSRSSCLLIGAAIFISAVGDKVMGATFAFTSVVTETDFDSVPPDFPLSFDIGDAITGTFTVPDIGFADGAFSGIDLDFKFDGLGFGISGVHGEMLSDKYVFLDGVAEPSLGPFDTIILGCTGDEAHNNLNCSESLLVPDGSVIFQASMAFGGLANWLTEGDLLSASSTWNSVALRQLGLTFKGADGTPIGTVWASIQPVTAVPEPQAIVMIVAFVGAVSAMGWVRRAKRPRQPC